MTGTTGQDVGEVTETTAEQDRRQIEVFTARQDLDRALGLAREIVNAVTAPLPIPGRQLRSWRERLHTLERTSGRPQ